MLNKTSLCIVAVLSQIPTTQSAEPEKSKYRRWAEQLGQSRESSVPMREEFHKQADEAIEKLAEINKKSKIFEENLATIQEKKLEVEGIFEDVVSKVDIKIDLKIKEITKFNNYIESLTLEVQKLKDQLSLKEQELAGIKSEAMASKLDNSELSKK